MGSGQWAATVCEGVGDDCMNAIQTCHSSTFKPVLLSVLAHTFISQHFSQYMSAQIKLLSCRVRKPFSASVDTSS